MIVQQYIKLRNAVNIENAWIKMYHFTQKLGEANIDIKETWKIWNSALCKRSKTTKIHKLEVNDNDVSDPKRDIRWAELLFLQHSQRYSEGFW